MDPIHQYIHLLYWSYGTCGTIAYGDFLPVTNTEKIYALLICIIAKVYLAFVFAEAASVVYDANAAFS